MKDDDALQRLAAQTRHDQWAAAADNLAVLLREYYGRLVERGFPPDQALVLTRDYQAFVLSAAKGVARD